MSKNILVKHLSKKEKDKFIQDVLECKTSKKNFREIISSWEATAEINSNPRVKKQILCRKKELDKFLMQLKND